MRAVHCEGRLSVVESEREAIRKLLTQVSTFANIEVCNMSAIPVVKTTDEFSINYLPQGSAGLASARRENVEEILRGMSGDSERVAYLTARYDVAKKTSLQLTQQLGSTLQDKHVSNL